MPEYDALVYDLDGTLVDLPVDWDKVAADVAAHLREHGLDPGGDLWEMLEASAAAGVRDGVEEIIAEYESAAAGEARRLSAADDVPADVPVGVCSLNCEAACRTALEGLGLAERVGVVVGRDSLDAEKPDPEPLLRAVEALGVDPGDALFVGDSPRDETAAARAEVPFAYVWEWN